MSAETRKELNAVLYLIDGLERQAHLMDGAIYRAMNEAQPQEAK